MFEAQAARTPGAIALSCQGENLTYGQLDLYATRMALRLRESGVLPGTFVAVYAPRSLETIAGLLAILKAGGAYVALDLESPQERLALMLADARPVVILTPGSLAGDLPACDAEILFLDEEYARCRDEGADSVSVMPGAHASAEDLAYVAFTSGSTGWPKGVCIPHRAVARLARAEDYITIANNDVFLQFAPLAFDASTFEIWCCLLNGARLVIFPPHKPLLDELGQFIEREKISILWLTAGLFHRMAEEHLHYFGGVRQWIVGGDVVSPQHAEKTLRALKNCRLINGYGPTENTTFSCCHDIDLGSRGESVPIGRPIAGTECLVLDEALRSAAEGELYLGGDGLSTGYLGNPELTAQKFIAHPHHPGARLYRTGDRVRLLPDGNLEFLGRIDRQAKILGYRVEPAEIEIALSQHPAVAGASVVVQSTLAGGERLVAAVILKPGMQAAPADLRAFARGRLPQHMVPAGFVFLDELPLNANGKIDRTTLAGLCALHEEKPAQPSQPAENHSATELVLVKIWTDVLGHRSFTTEDDFFDVGGNSLRAAHLLARIQVELHKTVPMSALPACATIPLLAALVDSSDKTPVPISLSRKGGSKPALFCLPGHGGLMTIYNSTVPHYSGARTIYGLQSPGLHGLREGKTVEEIAATHVQAIRELQSSGPYHLTGYCFGGLVAFEVARQLHAQGAEVGAVGMLHLDLHEMPFAPFRRRDVSTLLHFGRNLLRLPGEFFQIDAGERKRALQRIGYRIRGKWPSSTDALPPDTTEIRVWETHYQAWHEYVPRAFPGEVTLLRPCRLPLSHPNPKFGWDCVPGQRVQVRIVPGAGIHGQALKKQNAAGTARVIEQLIEDYERSRG